jgi:hydroxymethylbilane synthase
VPIAAIGGDGVFVRELEQALLDGRIDAAVHSLKDMPTAETAGLTLAGIPVRATPFDALVGRTAGRLEDLPAGARIGTSSIRRVVQLKAVRPDVEAVPLRGNVDTRLAKLDAGEVDALVLAAAGLMRLEMSDRIRARFDPAQMLPAAGQGALGIEVRADRQDIIDALAPLAHMPTWLTVTAERAVSRCMGGSCSMPLAAYGRFEGDILHMDAAWGDMEGDKGLVRVQASASVTDFASATALGEQLAAQLQAAGAVPAAPKQD